MKRNPSTSSRLLLVAVYALTTLINACAGPHSAARVATVDAISQAVRSSATEAALNAQGQAASVQTAQAQQAVLSQSVDATQTAQALQGDQSQSSAELAFAPFKAHLPGYGIDPNGGHPGWVHPPLTLDVQGYLQYQYANEFLSTVAADFVVSADITWNTQFGTSGCGFVLRSDGNRSAFNQYLVIATRGASGHVLFGVMSDGKLVNWRDIYAYGLDPQFDWQNGATNRLAVVAQGQIFTIYTNGTKIGEVNPDDPPSQPALPPPPVQPPDNSDERGLTAYAKQLEQYQQVISEMRSIYTARLRDNQNADKVFDKGFTAMVALNESGSTHCDFNNAWLWLIQ